MTNRRQFADLLRQVERVAADAADRDAALQAVCELLRSSVPHYDWVGFYLADNAARTLALGPFAGAPTEHVRIAYGRGICGQAAERLETFVVRDIREEANYLACSPHVRSEAVLPVMKGSTFVAELDIDSHTPSAFTDADVAFLERVAAAVASLF